jgi:ribose transport system ATP-binding protein
VTPPVDEPVSAATAKLEIGNLGKSFAGLPALIGLDLEIQAGEVHALIGENGSGKSTLIKILSGYHRPDPGGFVRIGGRPLRFGSPASSASLGLRFVHQDLGLIEAASIVDNLCIAAGYPTRWATIRRREARRRAKADLALVGIEAEPDRSVADLPPALKTGVAVARAVRADPGRPLSLLVLDEPTASFSRGEVRRLHEIVRAVAGRGVAALYVTHRLDEIFDVADVVSVLRDGRRVATRRAAEVTRRELVSLLVGGDAAGDAGTRRVPDAGCGTPALEVHALESDRVRDVDVVVRAGEIVGVAGVTGSGRETLLGAVFGAAPRQAGTVRVRGRAVPAMRPDSAIKAGAAFLPADRRRHGGMPDLSARENMTLADLSAFWKPPLLRRRKETEHVCSWSDALRIRPGGGLEMNLGEFSGGNQQKVLLAKWLRCDPAVLLLDEPTHGVDVAAQALLRRELRAAADRGCAVLFSSSELGELAEVADRVLVMRLGRIVADVGRADLSVATLSRLCLDGDTADGDAAAGSTAHADGSESDDMSRTGAAR